LLQNRGLDAYHETVAVAARFLLTNSRDLTSQSQYTGYNPSEINVDRLDIQLPYVCCMKEQVPDREDVPALD
jgi:hypothetical protein